MKIKYAVVASMVSALLAGCAEPAPTVMQPAAGWTSGPITDEETFRREVVGRPMTQTREETVSSGMNAPDGKMTVVTIRKADGVAIARFEGTWRFENGQYCRDIAVVEGSSRVPAAECQAVSKTGDEVTFTTSRGLSVWKAG